MTEKTEKTSSKTVEALFSVGAQYGMIRSRRHPSARPFIFGSKNKIEIFDLEKTDEALRRAKAFIEKKLSEGGTILFVGGKNEAREAIRSGASRVEMPFVAGRWLGGTLTNFTEIKKRIGRLETLLSQREKGELAKYTKLERLFIDREIERLQTSFSGLIPMRMLSKIVFIIDPKREHTAFAEAKRLGIPVVAIASSDCNMREVDHPIPANDSSLASISYFVSEIVSAVALAQSNFKKGPDRETEEKQKKEETKV